MIKRMFFAFFLTFFVSLNAVSDDNLDLKIASEVRFGDGFGTIYAYPQNITKELRNKLKFIGEYNLNKNNGNLEIKFHRIQYEGKVYDLTEPFEKKMRLKQPKNAKLKSGAKIKVAGGSREEILDIVNQKKQAIAKAEETGVQDALKRGDESSNGSLSTSSLLGSSSKSSDSSNYPYYYGSIGTTDSSSSVGDYSNSTTNSDGTCKAPSISGGVVSVYATTSSGGACKLFTTSESAIYYKYNQPTCPNKINKDTKEVVLGKEGFVTLDDNKEYKVVACQYEPLNVAENVYYKYNQPTCPNKVDYQSKLISLGREGFATLDDGKEYKVVSCEYMPEQTLLSELSDCRALTDFKNKIANIQEKFFYMLNNEKIEIGGCTPTGESVPLQEDLNYEGCTYRHDFVRNLSIKQVQWFYMQGNNRFNVGGCVDKDEEGFRFPHFEDDTTCEYEVVEDKVFYKNRLAFNDLTGGKQFATDCRVTQAGGIEIKEELAGYVYQDNLRQAQRKVNQYFLTPHTGLKKYVAKDVLSDKTYPYKETLCKWEHHDDEKYSLRFSKLFFINDDENIEVVVNECSDTIGLQTIPYAFMGENRESLEGLSGKTLIPQGDGTYQIYNTEDFIVNTPNFGRNAPSEKELLYEEGRNRDGDTWCGNGAGKIGWNSYTQEQKAGLNFSDSYVSSRSQCWGGNESGCNYYTTCKATIKAKPNYAINQILKQEKITERYRRGDGSYLDIKPRIEWRAK